MNILERLKGFRYRMSTFPHKLTRMQEALGRIEQRQITQFCTEIKDAEFRVFSQWGEDGTIQYLINHVPIERKLFIEFGVENYTESNTRFLLINNSWSGLVMDGCEENIAYIKKDTIYWGYNIKAENAFITRDNINDLIICHGITGDIGLLSVDIDGNDYWVWDAINCVSPRIVICEYNSLFGPTAKVVTPYDSAFVRDKAHFSKVYYGASIAALCELAIKKGYSLVTSNSAGNNVFFVRNDVLGELKALTPIEAYRRPSFREYHDENGNLTFDDFETRLDKIKELVLYELDSESTRKIREIAGIIVE
jgi:hypothetical protein